MDKFITFPFLEEWDWNHPDGNQEEEITRLLEGWGKVQGDLEILYQNRDQKKTILGMEKGIALFIQFLFWTNDQPVMLKEPNPLNRIEIKPVNLEERLGFILARPNLFHSYRQLSELMIELEKLFVKKKIKKASKPNG